ncbi:MAG: TRAP transporter large permease [Clostridia bacterium]|nr:TRAP transporter large permease [Clostridia bacterium]
MSPMTIGFLGIAGFLILMMLRMPIGVSMGLAGLIGFSFVNSPEAALKVLSSDIFNNFASYNLSIIVTFSLMGFLAYHAGIGSQLYAFAYKAVGHLPGGLAMASQVACAIFGAVCGSSTATTATIGSIAVPEMRKYKYNDSLSTASVAAGGAIGILIPPSVIFVIYGIATEQSIARLLISGIVPGILLTIAYMITVYILSKRNPELAPPRPGSRPSIGELLSTLKGGLVEVIIIFIISLGGMFLGYFTPTEAGGVGAAGVLLVTLLTGKMNWKAFNNSLRDTTRSAAMILFLVAGAVVFSRFLALSRMPFELAAWVSSLDMPNFFVMMVILLVYLIGGCLVEMIPLILLTIPIFFPIVVNVLGYDPIWFGVIIVMVTCIGVITPPVGINAYVIKGVAKDVPLETVFRGVWPFVIAATILTVILIAFPSISTFLPNLLMGK